MAAAVWLWTDAASQAETIHLSSGKTIQGKVLRQDTEYYYFQAEDGRKVKIRKAVVVRVERDDEFEEIEDEPEAGGFRRHASVQTEAIDFKKFGFLGISAAIGSFTGDAKDAFETGFGAIFDIYACPKRWDYLGAGIKVNAIGINYHASKAAGTEVDMTNFSIIALGPTFNLAAADGTGGVAFSSMIGLAVNYFAAGRGEEQEDKTKASYAFVPLDVTAFFRVIDDQGANLGARYQMSQFGNLDVNQWIIYAGYAFGFNK